MPDPEISVYEANDVTLLDDTESTTEFLPAPCNDRGVALHGKNYGNVKAGESTVEHEIHIWNNKGGNSNKDPALDMVLTVLNLDKQLNGGTLCQGKEIVEMKMIQVKDVTAGGDFVAIGGTSNIALGKLRGDKLETPITLAGVPAHGSGGQVLPGMYYGRVSALDETGETLASDESVGVEIESLFEQTVQNGDSESLSSGGNNRISYKVTGAGTYFNGVQLVQASGGSLQGTLRLETDDSGNPSGTLVSGNSEKLNVSLVDGVNTIFMNNEIPWVNGTTYHVVFIVTSGTGSLKGNTTGTDYQVKYYDGSWKTSSNLYDLYCVLIGDNRISWTWDETLNANTYKLFRTEVSGTYGDSSLVMEGIDTNSLEDLLCEPVEGKPVTASTCKYEHKKVLKTKVVVNPNVQDSPTTDFFFEIMYSK